MARRRTALLALPLFFAIALMAAPDTAVAQSDEIQVYDGGLAEVGVANLSVHNNFTPNGAKTPAFAGAVISDKSLNGVPEWAYGVTNWFEAGLYLPLYSIDKNQGALLNGFKLRTLFAVPDADKRKFVYGVNFEFSINARHWDPTRFTSEIRPILGWHLNSVDLFFNPILDTSYDGVKNLDFAPSTRVAFNVAPKWQVAAEEYADYGAVRHFNRGSDQSHQVFVVVDHGAKFMDVEAGVGFGLTDASDKLTLKLILSKDLNHK
jgi:hypothetical protein